MRLLTMLMPAKYRQSRIFLYPASQNNGVSINAVINAVVMTDRSFERYTMP